MNTHSGTKQRWYIQL